MYENFFGFKEKPFKLVPNPAYLFLSKSHEEALAHLNYAMAQGDGFVEITGEVGTGKTTLCRAFLDNLDEDTIAAYIFNPRLSAKQLIKTIDDELGIKYAGDDTKELIDKLNAFLMQKKAERKKIILLIDEAQNLSRNVLEQLRLLSNLETNTGKLLQIILVGQPELSDILDSHELRQLGQRITLRYRLTPLTYKETVEYIRYRLNIAAQKTGIKFDRSAFRQIFRYSRGIPRVINIACDRALLTAFGLGQRRITGSITRASFRELASRGAVKRLSFAGAKKAMLILAALAVGLAVAVFSQPMIRTFKSFFEYSRHQKLEVPAATVANSNEAKLEEAHLEEPDLEQTDLEEPDLNEPSAPVISMEDQTVPQPEKMQRLAQYLTSRNIGSSRYGALKYVMNLWQIPVEFKPYLESLDDDQAFFRLTAKASGLFIHRLETDIDMLKRLNLPAILEFYPPGSEDPAYLTLSKIDGDKIRLGGTQENEVIEADIEEINFYWSGIAYIPWKNFLSILGTIPLNYYKDSIITLKLLLHELGFKNVELNDDYDDWTRKAIEEIQAKYGIPVDGFVGPLTKIILYREKNSFEMPYLVN